MSRAFVHADEVHKHIIEQRGRSVSASTRIHEGRFTAQTALRKFCVLVALTTQNTALVLVTKFSYTRPAVVPYLSSTVVACAECMKFLTSCALLVYTEGRPALASAIRDVRSHSLQLALPSVLYVIQNNLLFEGMRSLSPTLYMVCAQSKILTSAFFSVLVLKAEMTRRQVFALVMLASGMIFVQHGEGQVQALSPEVASATGVVLKRGNVTYGVVVVLAATSISGFTGALLERMYKKGVHGTRPQSIWFRNTQLAYFSVPVAFMSAYWRDGEQISSQGVLQGYDVIVIIIILLQAAGGLVVAGVMRYAGNVLKCFAVSISMCMCASFTRFQLSTTKGEPFNTVFLSGFMLVIASTFAYSIK